MREEEENEEVGSANKRLKMSTTTAPASSSGAAAEKGKRAKKAKKAEKGKKGCGLGGDDPNILPAVFDYHKPTSREHPWALRLVTPRVAVGEDNGEAVVEKATKFKGETIHRENLLSIAERCIGERDWINAARAAQLLIRMIDGYKHERKGQRLSQHSSDNLVKVWKVVFEIALHFPEQFKSEKLAKFARQMYNIAPLKHKSEIAAGMVDISLVNDHPQRTFLLIDQLRGNFAKNAEQTLLSGLVKYQEWLLSMEGPERLDFTSEFQKMLEGSTHSWYNPRSWSSATVELYSEAKDTLMEFFRLPAKLNFKTEWHILNRLFHLHAVKNEFEILSAHIDDYRRKQRKRLQSQPSPGLIRIEILLCLVLGGSSGGFKAPGQKESGSVVDRYEPERLFPLLFDLAEKEPSSEIPLVVLKFLDSKGDELPIEMHDYLEDGGLEPWLQPKGFSRKGQVLRQGLRLAFIHLDVRHNSETAWYYLALALDMLRQKQVPDELGEELEADLEEYWGKDRKEWWGYVHFRPQRIQRDLDLLLKNANGEGSQNSEEFRVLQLKFVSSSYLGFDALKTLISSSLKFVGGHGTRYEGMLSRALKYSSKT